MPKEINLITSPEIAFNPEALQTFIYQKFNPRKSSDFNFKLLRRSIDARSREIKVNLSILTFENEKVNNELHYKIPTIDVSKSESVIIIGAGPAGLFAALKCLDLNLKPIILERGKNVKERRRDLAAINKEHIVNPESNYCFGEGGAGTYSDGKLYTRSHKRGDIHRILEILVAHGAPNDILIDAHPHIGTNKLPQLIENVRNTILQCGGEIHFNTKVIDFNIYDNKIQSVITENGLELKSKNVVLATGHSARDIFYLLNRKNIAIENKPFALGVRVEHSQQFIDAEQYHTEKRSEYLPPSSYSLVTQTNYNGENKGVFSFCMCPGGIIAPCATEQGEIVVNGWSPSKRNNYWANSGIVTEINAQNWSSFEKHGNLAALEFQKSIEKKACEMAGSSQKAPAQLLTDFINNKVSTYLNKTSYQPGLESINLSELFPIEITNRLKNGFHDFNKKIKGFVSSEAQIVAVESRTSSPVKIPRDKDTCQHVHIKNLYPCGEGAGYAGGIVSAAMDGERVVNAIFLNSK